MSQEDSVKILKECDSGIKMALTSIGEVLDSAQSEEMRKVLLDSADEHEKIGNDVRKMLRELNEDEKSPNPIASVMSWTKINAKLLNNPSDSVIAGLMTDGCSMVIKKVSQYVNQYPTAETPARNAAHRLVKTEQDFMDKLRVFL